jgi:hypothetical protein
MQELRIKNKSIAGSELIQDVFSDFQIIPIHKQPQPSNMQIPTLRERQRFTHKLTHPLPERVIPPFQMIR